MTRKEILEKTIDFDDAVNRIIRLEAEVKEWKDKADLWCKTANLKDHNIMINKELEKENADLQKSYEELYNSMRVIKDQRNVLEKENAELKAELSKNKVADCHIVNGLCEQLTKAKELIENVIRVTWGEGWNYSLDWKVKAEQFLKNNA